MSLAQLLVVCFVAFAIIYSVTIYYSFNHFNIDISQAFGEIDAPIGIKNVLSKQEKKMSFNLRPHNDIKLNLKDSFIFNKSISSLSFPSSSSSSSSLSFPSDTRPRWVSSACTNYIDTVKIKRSVIIIITVRNEEPLNLMSTILSIVKNSGDNLLRIVIVDDNSERKVEDWEIWSNNKIGATEKDKIKQLVRFVRTKTRLGVSGSKALGAEFALNLKQPPEVLLFLESNVLVSENWLHPLIDVLEAEPNSIVYPAIDVFIPPKNSKTVKDVSKISIIKADNVVGGFDWSLNFIWEALDEKIGRSRINVLSKSNKIFSDADLLTASPAAPGIIAVNSKFYSLIGGWDQSLGLWGTESVELSIRTWLCGGKVIRQPCSRVAQSSADIPLFSQRSPPSGIPQATVDRNVLSIAERYMRPKYKEIVYQARFNGRIPSPLEGGQNDRFPKQFATIKEFSAEICQDFEWFVKEVYPGLDLDVDAVRNSFQAHLSTNYLSESLDYILSQYSKSSSNIVINKDDIKRLNSILSQPKESALQEMHNSRVPDKVPYIHPNSFKVLGLGGDSNDRSAVAKPDLFPEGYEPIGITVERILPEASVHEIHANDVRTTLVCNDEPEDAANGMSCEKKGKASCQGDIGYMMFGCPSYCGWCGSDGLICVDMYVNKCPKWASEGRCDIESDLLSKICRKSCKFCGKGFNGKGNSAPAKIDNNEVVAKSDAEAGVKEISQPKQPPAEGVISIETTEIVDPYKAQTLFSSGNLRDSDENACDLNGTPNGELLSRYNINDVSGNPIKIFCAIYTMEKNHDTNVKATRDTWAKRCDGFVAFSTKSDPEIPAIRIEHEGPESYDNMWQKSRSIWKYIYKHFMNDFDYFLIGGDDMFYIPENLKHYLNSPAITSLRESSSGVYVGRRFIPPGSEVFNSGGAGYVIDKKSLKVLGENLDSPNCHAHQVGFWEDVNIAHCLKVSAGIVPIDTRDDEKRERFNPFTPGHHLTYQLGDKNDWYTKYHPYGLLDGFNCCSPDGVSFHYVPHELLRKLYDYTYSCKNKKKTNNFAKGG